MYCCGAGACRFRQRAAFKAHPLWLYERHRIDSTAEPSSKALRLLCHCKGTVAPSLGNRRQDPQRERKHYGTRDRSRHPRSDTFAEEQTASSRYSDRGRRGHGHSRGLRPRSSRRRVRAWSPAARIALANISLCPCRRLGIDPHRSEEHTSELQSRGHLVCRLLLEKKNTYTILTHTQTLIAVRL